ncbi:hypothetical protein QAD02_015169 [Eretmocerus hayati]|uniref:Uncharacterized protein n=1 Tax=Eretmocerus hayati TaxID=131215 RepID=A0ACC2P7H6_9HYME|nr:hypothetical protein QAD02_015169 [Eretmocerus hayati]
MLLVFAIIPMILAAIFIHPVSAQQIRNRRLPPAVKKKPSGLMLPDNATSIRENIVDTFSCDGRIYGYYADTANDCQVFHVCVPRNRRTLRYSFICPAETVFNQVTFVCTREEDSIRCAESERYYDRNKIFGGENGQSTPASSSTNMQNNETVVTSTSPHRPTTKPTTTPAPTSTTNPQGTSSPQWSTSRPPAAVYPPNNYPQKPQTPLQRPTNYPINYFPFAPDYQTTPYPHGSTKLWYYSFEIPSFNNA